MQSEKKNESLRSLWGFIVERLQSDITFCEFYDTILKIYLKKKIKQEILRKT